MKKYLSFALMLLALAVGSQAAAAVPTGSLLDGVKPGADGKINVITIFPIRTTRSPIRAAL